MGNTRAKIADKDGDNLVLIDPNDPDQDELMNIAHYYPFRMKWETPQMDENGNLLESSGVKDRYTYNGKEFQDDLGINWHYYGFRMYDPAIARFTSVDPIAEEFAHLSTFNYADNSPIANIDLHGLQALYAADGTLIGYSVQEGQGPTQIAEDLKENYGCQLSCEVDWTQIVYDNGSEFQNVFDGDGNVTDKFNEDFKSGNINPGDQLVITGGIDQTQLKEQKDLLREFEVTENVTLDIIKGKKEGISGIREDKMDPDDRIQGANHFVDHAKEMGPVKQLKKKVRNLEKKLHDLNYKQDSMKSEIKKTKGQ